MRFLIIYNCIIFICVLIIIFSFLLLFFYYYFYIIFYKKLEYKIKERLNYSKSYVIPFKFSYSKRSSKCIDKFCLFSCMCVLLYTQKLYIQFIQIIFLKLKLKRN